LNQIEIVNLYRRNIVERSTALKPFAIQYLLQRGYDSVMFLDPDIFVLGLLDHAFEIAESDLVVLTPHRLSPTCRHRTILDLQFLRYGTFNLGFIAVSNTPMSHKMLSWWRACVLNSSTTNHYTGAFTDQKWINLAPNYFPTINLTDSSFNIAPWNIDERFFLFGDSDVGTENQTPSPTPTFIHFSQRSHLPEEEWIPAVWLESSCCAPVLNDHKFTKHFGQIIFDYRFLLESTNRIFGRNCRDNFIEKRKTCSNVLNFRSLTWQATKAGFSDDFSRLRGRLRSLSERHLNEI